MQLGQISNHIAPPIRLIAFLHDEGTLALEGHAITWQRPHAHSLATSVSLLRRARDQAVSIKVSEAEDCALHLLMSRQSGVYTDRTRAGGSASSNKAAFVHIDRSTAPLAISRSAGANAFGSDASDVLICSKDVESGETEYVRSTTAVAQLLTNCRPVIPHSTGQQHRLLLSVCIICC